MGIRVLKDNPLKMYYKNSHLSSTYDSITVKNNIWTIDRLNHEDLPISTPKYNDLLSLCAGDVRVVRNQEHIEFYTNLPH